MPIPIPRGGLRPGKNSATRWIAAAAAVSALAGGAGAAIAAVEPTAVTGHDFVTRPDLHPPVIDVHSPASGTEPGSLFLTPIMPVTMGLGPQLESSGQPGPLIADDTGQPIWFAPNQPGKAAMDLHVQQYRGAPVLTWFEGKVIVPPGFGQGEFVVADQSYNRVATIAAGNGLQADLHDMVITPQNTALLLAYRDVKRDLTGIGGPPDATVSEGVIQEIDIANGAVLFEWHSLDHVGEDESMLPLPQDAAPWDYFHVNSVDVDGDGNLLISARNTHALYQINRGTGAVNWRLNGKKSDFRMGAGAGFEWQHDARRQPDGSITVFDNAAAPKDRSRGISLKVDESARTADLTRATNRPEARLSPNMGNHQTLGNGHSFIGWGGDSGFTEFGPDGTVLLDAKFHDGMPSYRAFRSAWVGKPADSPAVAGTFGDGDSTRVFASWNGATEVRSWRVLAGPDAEHLLPVQDAARSGFETSVEIPGRQPYVAVEALDAGGAVLGTSAPVRTAE